MIDLNDNEAILYYTPEIYEEYQVGNRVIRFGRMIQILERAMRNDLGDYFEIRFRYEY